MTIIYLINHSTSKLFKRGLTLNYKINFIPLGRNSHTLIVLGELIPIWSVHGDIKECCIL